MRRQMRLGQFQKQRPCEHVEKVDGVLAGNALADAFLMLLKY